MRLLRISVLGALTVGLVLTMLTGWSFASHAFGQTGYGTQVLGEQIIRPKASGGTDWGLWIGIAAALGILGSAGLYGWRNWQEEQAEA
jgi:hypothetical protein